MIYAAELEGLTLAQIEAAIGEAPTLTIFAGEQPASTEDADPDDPLVAIVLPDDWLLPESGGGASMNDGPWIGIASGSGVALSWRIAKDGTTYLQGSAGHRNSSAEMRLRNHNLRADQVVQVTQFRLSTGPISLAALAVTESTDSMSIAGTTSTVTPPSTDRVQVGQLDSSYSRASTELDIVWDPSDLSVTGGTWLDANNTQNGTVHRVTGTIAVGATSASFNIASISGDLFVKGIPPGSATPGLAAFIDGVAVEGFWMAASSNAAVVFGFGSSTASSPIIIKNHARGSTLLLSWTNAQTTQRSITINQAVGPLIPTYARDTVERTAPTLYDIDVDSYETLDAFLDAEILLRDPVRQLSFGVEANGLKYMRFCIPGGGNTAVNGRKSLIPYGQLGDVYFQYTMMIESSAWDNINEDGIKLPGPTDSLDGVSGLDELSWRTWHGPKSQNNRDLWKFSDYRYSASSGSGFANIAHTNALVRANEWFTVTQHIRLNTLGPGGGAPVEDGIARLWINDTLVIDETDYIWRTKSTTFVRMWHFNIFHGGTALTNGDMFYRVARIRASEQMIGCPTELLTGVPATFPVWRQDQTPFVSFDIEGTNASSLNVGTYGTNSWNGMATSDDGRLFNSCSGGHGSDAAVPGRGNKTITCDLNSDGPSWSVIHTGTPDSRLSAALGDGEVAYNTGPYGSGSTGQNITAYVNLRRDAMVAGGFSSVRGRINYPGGEPGDTTAVPVPTPRHSYYSTVWLDAADTHDSKERVMLMQANAIRAPNGTGRTYQVNGFKVADLAWDHPGSDFTLPPGDGFWTDAPTLNRGNSIFTFCRDSRTGLVYVGSGDGGTTGFCIFSAKVAGGGWYRSPAELPAPYTGTAWTSTGLSGPNFNNSGALIDEGRERWGCVRNRSSTDPRLEFRYLPLNGGQIVRMNISENFQYNINAANTVLGGQHTPHVGMTHCLDDDKYWLCIGTGPGSQSGVDQYWRIDPETGEAEMMEELTTRTPKGPSNGFTYIAHLGGIIHFRNIGGNSNWPAQNLRFIPTR